MAELKSKVYLAKHKDGTELLVEAANKSRVRNYLAETQFEVSIASAHDAIRIGNITKADQDQPSA